MAASQLLGSNGSKQRAGGTGTPPVPPAPLEPPVVPAPLEPPVVPALPPAPSPPDPLCPAKAGPRQKPESQSKSAPNPRQSAGFLQARSHTASSPGSTLW